MMAGTGPTISHDPITLLTPDLSRPEPFINKYWGGALVGGTCWAVLGLTNYLLHKPVFSSLHHHAIAASFGWVTGQYYDNMRKEYLAERDAVLRHYITLHPEDFPAIESQKYSELFLPWHPVR